MNKYIGITDFFGEEQGKIIPFENLIKWIDYNSSSGFTEADAYDLAYYLEDYHAKLADFKIKVVKNHLFYPTMCLSDGKKEYVYKMSALFATFLEIWNTDTPLTVFDLSCENVCESFSDCELSELIESLEGNYDLHNRADVDLYGSYYRCNIFPYLLRNPNFDVIKWSLEHLIYIGIDMDNEIDPDEFENEEYDTQLPGFTKEESNKLTYLLNFVADGYQSSEHIEYIRTHIKTGREITEDSDFKRIQQELGPNNPDWNTIFNSLEHISIKCLVKFEKNVNSLLFYTPGALNHSVIEIPKDKIKEITTYFHGDSNEQ